MVPLAVFRGTSLTSGIRRRRKIYRPGGGISLIPTCFGFGKYRAALLVMKTKFLALILFGGLTVFGADFSVGIRIGPPPAPRVVRVPRSPGAGYFWVEGYWYPVGGRYVWHNGYWTRPPYGGANWIKPRYEGGRFFEGYWEGDRGRREHDHRWDRTRDRDYDHDRDQDRDRDRDRDRH
jgi:hypothetical protein